MGLEAQKRGLSGSGNVGMIDTQTLNQASAPYDCPENQWSGRGQAGGGVVRRSQKP